MPRLVLFALAWFAGLLLAAWQTPPWPLPAAVAATAVACLAGAGQLAPPRQRVPLLAASLCLVGALAALRVALADWRPALAAWQPLFGRHAVVVGVVADDPSARSGYLTVRLAVDDLTVDGQPILSGGAWLAAAGEATPDGGRGVCRVLAALCAPPPHIQARFRPATPLQYGDRVRLTGRLDAAPILETFPYQQTLARSGVYGLLRPGADGVQVLAKGQGAPLRQMAVGVRARAEASIDRLFPRQPVEAGLLKGALLGLENRLTPEVEEALRRASLSHIIVVSGFNITIVVLGLTGLLFLLRAGLGGVAALAALSRRWTVAVFFLPPVRALLTTSPLYPMLTLTAVAAYVLLVGASPSAVRAALMGAAVVVAVFIGRPATGLVALCATAWLITLVMPWAALDVGFQLSFAGTLGLVALAPILDAGLSRRLAQRPLLRGLSGGAAVTVAAMLMTAPLLSYYFGQVSLLGLLANLLALPAQPPVMYLGAAATLADALGGGPARLLAGLAWLPLRWSVWVADILGSAPWAAAEARLTTGQLLLLYAWLAVAAYWAAGRWGRDRVARVVPPPLPAVPGPPQRPVTSQPIARVSLRAAQPASQTPTWLMLGLAAVAVVWGAATLAAVRADGLLRVVALGRGETVVVQTPAGHRLVIGGGATATDTVAAVESLGWAWDRSVAVVAATRGDRAFIEALAEVLRRYRVAHAAAPAFPDGAASVAWQQAALEKGNAPLPPAGGRLALGDGVVLETVAVDEVAETAVYRLVWGDVSILIASGIHMSLPMPDGAISALLLSSRADARLAADLARRTTPAVVVVQEPMVEGGDDGAAVIRVALGERRVVTSAEQGEIILVSDGHRLWLQVGR